MDRLRACLYGGALLDKGEIPAIIETYSINQSRVTVMNIILCVLAGVM
jgi:hypothetical protein